MRIDGSFSVLVAILVSSFLFSSYQLVYTQGQIIERAKADLTRAAQYASNLRALEQSKLDAVARALAGGPILRSALQTKHRPTIDATLTDLRTNNGLERLEVTYQNNSSSSGIPASQSMIIGTATDKIENEPFTVTLAMNLGAPLLEQWKLSSGADFILWDKSQAIAATLDTASLVPGTESGVETYAGSAGNSFYAMPMNSPGALRVSVLLPRAPYGFQVRQERNHFFFFCGLVVLAGFAVSIFLSRYRFTQLTAGVSAEEWNRLLQAVEDAKKRNQQ